MWVQAAIRWKSISVRADIIVYEAHSEIRRVYFGDRNAVWKTGYPGDNGYSSGRWEAMLLVVETDNLVDRSTSA